MITKELLKNEIDNVQEEYLEPLYKMIKALEQKSLDQYKPWHHFIEETYGCLSDDSIERGDQGQHEHRRQVE